MYLVASVPLSVRPSVRLSVSALTAEEELLSVQGVCLCAK